MTVLRALMASILASFALIVSATAAHADESLVASLPKPRQELSQRPSEVRLAFSMALADGQITVTDSKGRSALAENTVIEINNASARLKADLPRGTYTAKYRIKSIDTGRTYGGSFQFAFGSGDFVDLPQKAFGGSNNVPPELAAGTTDSTATPTPTPSATEPSITASPSPIGDAAATSTDSGTSDWWWAAIPLGLLAGFGVLVMTRRRASTDDPVDSNET